MLLAAHRMLWALAGSKCSESTSLGGMWVLEPGWRG